MHAKFETQKMFPRNKMTLSRTESDDPLPLHRSDDTGSGLSTHSFLKWPAYILIATCTVGLLLGYSGIRGLIKIFENLMEGNHVKKLRAKMLAARNFRQWQMVARRLDTYSGLDGWKQSKKSKHYNVDAVEKFTRHLQEARLRDNAPRVLGLLQACLSDPLTAGVFKEELYSQCWDGTKLCVEEYIQTVVMCICYLTQLIKGGTHSEASVLRSQIPLFFEKTSYGRAAVCLSGGGSIGQQHFGVLKALWEEGVLPSVISGTSAGAVVGAFFCTRTDLELDREFNANFILSISTALSDPWRVRLVRLMRTGHLFDFAQWEREIAPWTCGDLTFAEAHRKTGRTLNISTTANNCSVNLNHITSPNVLIRSAALCSSAMPFFVKPPKLLEKLESGEILLRDAQNFSDGSLAGDVPRGELGSLFGVRFVLTSQVNPHISPFFFNRKGEAGNPLLWRWGKAGSFRGGFLLSALESFFKEQMKTLLKVMHDLEVDPLFRGLDLPQAFLQNFEGDITVTSHRHSFWKAINSLEGPKNAQEVDWWIKEGCLMMWPKMSVMISRMRIENALLDLSDAAISKAVNGAS